MRFLIRVLIIVVLIVLVWRLVRSLTAREGSVEVIPPKRRKDKR